MKKIICLLVFSIISTSFCLAQDYKKFSVRVGVGDAHGSGYSTIDGILITVEPSYRIKNNISVGLRFETTEMVPGFSIDIPVALNRADFTSYTVNSHYYFGKKKFRPFAGAGFGIYSLGAVSNSDTGTWANSTTKFGYYPRFGFDVGHFSLSADYNFIPRTKVGSSTLELVNNYCSIRIGFSFGGGKK